MTALNVDIWMPFYIGDYLADTTRLSTEEHGAYLLLLVDHWRNGPLPDNDRVMRQITRLSAAGWRRSKAALARYFRVENGLWLHDRIQEEKLEAEELQRKRSEQARSAAETGWEKRKKSKAGDSSIAEGEANSKSADSNANATANSNAAAYSDAMPAQCPSQSQSQSTLTTNPNTQQQGVGTGDQVNGTRLPNGWSPPEDDLAFCRKHRPELAVPELVERFRSYWQSQPGSKAWKTDWSDTWRKWVMRENAPASSAPQHPAARQSFANVNYREGISADGKIV